MTSNGALIRFGDAVRKARAKKRWTLEGLAHEVLGNSERKSYVSGVENGKRKLSPLTIQKFADKLELPEAVVDAAMGVSSANQPTDEQGESTAAALKMEVEDVRKQLKLSEALVIALAYEFAEGDHTDLASAVRGLREALDVARRRQEQATVKSNFGEEVDEILRRVAALNKEGQFEDGAELVDQELAALEEAEAELQARRIALLNAGIDQDYLRRGAGALAAKLIQIAKLELAAGDSLFDALRTNWIEWYERGDKEGLNFDLEVSIELARASQSEARDADQRGKALNDLGVLLWTLGQRESGTTKLEEAVTAYRAAQEERTRNRVPLEWADRKSVV